MRPDGGPAGWRLRPVGCGRPRAGICPRADGSPARYRPPRQARRQERELSARRDPADGSARAEVLARGMEQALRHERESGQQRGRQPTQERGSR